MPNAFLLNPQGPANHLLDLLRLGARDRIVYEGDVARVRVSEYVIMGGWGHESHSTLNGVWSGILSGKSEMRALDAALGRECFLLVGGVGQPLPGADTGVNVRNRALHVCKLAQANRLNERAIQLPLPCQLWIEGGLPSHHKGPRPAVAGVD